MKKPSGSDLTPEQQRFTAEYCVDLNATAAYMRAGYRARGNSAEAAACRLLSNVKVQEAIEQKQREVAKRCELTVENIVREAAAVAFSDIRRLFNTDGSPKPLNEIDDATAAAIPSIEIAQMVADGKVTGRMCKIKFWDKNSAPRRIKVVFVSPDGEVVPFSSPRKAGEN